MVPLALVMPKFALYVPSVSMMSCAGVPMLRRSIRTPTHLPLSDFTSVTATTMPGGGGGCKGAQPRTVAASAKHANEPAFHRIDPSFGERVARNPRNDGARPTVKTADG